MNNRRYSYDVFSEGRKCLNDWDSKMDDYARKRRMQSRRLLRRGQSSGTKQALTADDEMEKLRQEKSKRRSLKKPVQSEIPIVQPDKRQVEIKQLMSENKELLKRCDETLKKQLDIACEIGANELDQAKEDLDATIERSRKLLEDMDDGTLTETEDLDDIRRKLMQRRQSAPASSINTTPNSSEQVEIKTEHDFFLQQRLKQLEIDIEKGRKIIEAREAKRNDFLKRQNKHYCQIVWKQLANENKDEN